MSYPSVGFSTSVPNACACTCSQLEELLHTSHIQSAELPTGSRQERTAESTAGSETAQTKGEGGEEAKEAGYFSPRSSLKLSAKRICEHTRR